MKTALKNYCFGIFSRYVLLLFIAVSAGGQALGEPELVAIENDSLSVTINRKGAELWSIQDQVTQTEFLWQGGSDLFRRRAPIMFPAVVRFRDNAYTYKGKRYEMPILGLAVASDFEVIPSKSPTVSILELTSSRSTLRYYPFPFRFRVTRRLDGNVLHITYTVENTGDETMFFALGGHPGLMLPLDNGLGRSDCCLVFSEPVTADRMSLVEGLVQQEAVGFLRNDDKLNLADERVPESGMLVPDFPVRKIGVALTGKPPFAEVDLGDFPNVNLYTPPGTSFVSIEPLLSHHDFADSPEAIEEKPHLMSLVPGASKTCGYSITIRSR